MGAIRLDRGVRFGVQSLAALAIGLGWGVPGIAQVAPKSRCLADLVPAIAQLQQDARWARSRWGVAARTLNPSNPQTLVSLEEQRFFVPASNAKLFSTAAALMALGPEFRSPTRAYWRPSTPAQPRPAWLIVPGGDPNLTSAQLRAWADRLAQLHPPREPMDVVVFDREETPPSWEWDDLIYSYAPVVNRAIVNRNAARLSLTPQATGLEVQMLEDLPSVLDWFRPSGFQMLPDGATPTWSLTHDRATGATILRGGIPQGTSVQLSLAIPQPGRQFAWVLADRLSQIYLDSRRDRPSPPPRSPANSSRSPLGFGTRVPGTQFLEPPTSHLPTSNLPASFDRFRNPPVVPRVSAMPLPEALGQPAAQLDSSPLADTIVMTNQTSDNLAAEVLLRWLDADRPLDRLRQVLTELGVSPDGYRLVDGSGLSRQNLVSPEAIVQLLSAMARSPYRDLYQNSLPLAGRSGTLANRFQNTPLAGRLRAKTGTMTGVSSLAGYLDHPEWGPIAVSIMVDHATAPTADLRQAMDQVVGWLDEARSCP